MQDRKVFAGNRTTVSKGNCSLKNLDLIKIKREILNNCLFTAVAQPTFLKFLILSKALRKALNKEDFVFSSITFSNTIRFQILLNEQ
jgi:hypothetical protein